MTSGHTSELPCNAPRWGSNGGHGGFNGTGSVGACHVDHCRFNQGLLCTAQAISVGQHAGHADCATYERR